MKILFTRGDGIYIAQKDDTYYLVNLELPDEEPLQSKYVDSFLKFGYFDAVSEVPEDIRKVIEERISQ